MPKASPVWYLSPDGEIIASGGCDRAIQLWHLATGKALQSCIAHDLGVLCLTFAPNGQTLISGDLNHAIKVWHL
uniref:WD40 repeat domain-containing protein n=1 Tax=Desertifilum tharense IPPAS B-1220 TaxID=1781255 RepID=A0ACD5GU25_9CYAN